MKSLAPICGHRRRSAMWDAYDPRTSDSRDLAGGDARDHQSVEPREVFTRGLDLPRGRTREHVVVRTREYWVRGSEVRALATIGAFRIVSASDLRDDAGRAGDVQ